MRNFFAYFKYSFPFCTIYLWERACAFFIWDFYWEAYSIDFDLDWVVRRGMCFYFTICLYYSTLLLSYLALFCFLISSNFFSFSSSSSILINILVLYFLEVLNPLLFSVLNLSLLSYDFLSIISWYIFWCSVISSKSNLNLLFICSNLFYIYCYFFYFIYSSYFAFIVWMYFFWRSYNIRRFTSRFDYSRIFLRFYRVIRFCWTAFLCY